MIAGFCYEKQIDQISFDQLEDFVQNGGQTDSITAEIRDNNLKSTPISQQIKIPKLIMQTWKDRNIPDHWKESPKSIKEHMKDWTYVLMTDEDNFKFCKKYFPDFLPYFKSFPHAIQRADAIRYMFLYQYGGVYLDLDLVIVKPLDPLFSLDAELYLCSSGNVGSCLTNSFMACKPKCGFWLSMIDYMKTSVPWWCIGKHMEVMNSTGPVALNYMIKKEGYPYLALPPKMVMPCSVCNITHCKIGDSYLKPLIGSSWISYDTKFMNFFLCNWREIIIAIIIILVLLIIYLIIHYSCNLKLRIFKNS